MASKQPETGPVEPPKPLTIFERHKIKSALTNRIMRALKEAADDDMRKAILADVSQMNALMQAT